MKKSETFKKKEYPLFIQKKHRLTSQIYLDYLLKMCELIDTPVALAIYLQVKYKQPITTDVNPINYLTPAAYLQDAQALAFFKKNPHYECGIDKANVALSKFLEAEARCSETNSFFIKHHGLPKYGDLWEILFSARHFCMNILGESVPSLKPTFGPGATLSLKGADTNLVSKLSAVPEVTPEAYEYAREVLADTMPHYMLANGSAVRIGNAINVWGVPNVAIGSRFSTVPKDWRTDRPICIEPSANMLLQKAYGDLIRTKLKKYGLDLDTRPNLHKQIVREASVNDAYATIDLSSASDTIAYELVKFLLPQEWFDHLKRVRCARTILPDGSVLHNEKFSSMGNGYTFELESLLFYSILLAVRKYKGRKSDFISTFGDDIIVPSNLSDDTIRILEFCGFIINIEKSFVSGPFKESCGHDFLGGIYVRPTYFKSLEDKQPIERLYYFLNRIRKMAHNLNFGVGCDAIFRAIWQDILDRVPAALRLFGPEDFGDSVILGHHGFHFKYLRRKSRKYKSGDGHVQLAAALYGVAADGIVPRGVKYDLAITRIYQPCVDSLWVSWI